MKKCKRCGKNHKNDKFCSNSCSAQFLGEKRIKKYGKDLIGKRFGKWIIIKDALDFPRKKDSLWWCKCDCGLIKLRTRNTILSGQSTKCKNCAKLTTDEFPYHVFSKIRSNALSRKLDFLVNRDYLYSLYLKQNKKCNYSKINIIFSKSVRDNSHSKTTASLDRIDSSKGYIEGNVQWLHKHINKMKQGFPENYFFYMCKTISDNIDKDIEYVDSSRISYTGKIIN